MPQHGQNTAQSLVRCKCLLKVAIIVEARPRIAEERQSNPTSCYLTTIILSRHRMLTSIARGTR